MNTIGELKEVVKEYLQVEAPSVIDSTLQMGGDQLGKNVKIDNLILRAANTARIKAERKHDFGWADDTVQGVIPMNGNGLPFDHLYEIPKYKATLVINSAGTSTLTYDTDITSLAHRPLVRSSDTHFAVEPQVAGAFTTDIVKFTRDLDPIDDFPDYVLSSLGGISNGTYAVYVRSINNARTEENYTERYRKIKTINDCCIVDEDDNDVPIRYEKKARLAKRSLEHQERRTELGIAWNFTTLISIGERFFLYPESTATDQTIRVDANLWMPEYLDDSDSDSFLKHGFDYMQWACIVELNRLLQVFVPRQEGNIPPPNNERDEALKELIEFDIFQSETGSTDDLD